MIDKLNKWHKTRVGYIVFCTVGLALAYGFISLAIDRGNFWYYLLAGIFLFQSLKNFTKLIGTLFNGKRKTS